MTKPRDENFLVRWSRRKQADRVAPERSIDDPEPATSEVEFESGKAAHGSTGHDALPTTEGDSVSQPVATPEDLAGVDVDALNYESDFKRFLESDVPEALRKRALRQLWRSDPILANVDGLNDYDEDFSDAALAVKVLETAHKIGRGYLESDDDDAKNVTESDVATMADADEAESTDGEIQLASNEDNPNTPTDTEDGEAETK